MKKEKRNTVLTGEEVDKSFFISFLVSLLIFGAGALTGFLWAPLSTQHLNIAKVGQIVSGFFFLWAALGLVDYGVVSAGLGPRSEAQEKNSMWFKWISAIGMFVLFTCSFALLLSEV